MNVETIIRRIGEIGIMPVIRAANADEALRAVAAVCASVPRANAVKVLPRRPALQEHFSKNEKGGL